MYSLKILRMVIDYEKNKQTKRLIDSIFVKHQRDQSLMIKLEIHWIMHNERYDYVSYKLKFAWLSVL